MINWVISNIVNIALVIIIAFILFLVIRKMILDKEKGKSPCGCDCGCCPSKDMCHK